MAYSNFTLNQRITNLQAQLNALKLSCATLSGDNNFVGTNDFSVHCPTTEIDATESKQLTNYETVVALIAGGGSNILNTDNTWTGVNNFQRIYGTELFLSSRFRTTGQIIIWDGIGTNPRINITNTSIELINGASIHNHGPYLDATNSLGTNNQILSSTGVATQWIDLPSSSIPTLQQVVNQGNLITDGTLISIASSDGINTLTIAPNNISFNNIGGVSGQMYFNGGGLSMFFPIIPRSIIDSNGRGGIQRQILSSGDGNSLLWVDSPITPSSIYNISPTPILFYTSYSTSILDTFYIPVYLTSSTPIIPSNKIIYTPTLISTDYSKLIVSGDINFYSPIFSIDGSIPIASDTIIYTPNLINSNYSYFSQAGAQLIFQTLYIVIPPTDNILPTPTLFYTSYSTSILDNFYTPIYLTSSTPIILNIEIIYTPNLISDST